MYQKSCKSCGSTLLYKEARGNNTGLYCSECGKWQKWLTKDEIRAFEYAEKQITSEMRKPTPKENQAISECLNQISKPTGYNVFDDKTIIERLEKFVEYLNRKIDIEYDKAPLSMEDAIRKNSYCLALEQDKNAILNIIHGHEFDFKERL